MKPLELDLRSLASFRIATGLLLILDLANRARYLRAHYTDFGVLPRTALIETEWQVEWFSLHLASGQFWFQALIFLIGGVLAILVLIGYRTRVFWGVSWLFLISLQARNPLVSQGGDILLRVLMFWGFFLPLGARYSIDSLCDSHPETDQDAAQSGSVLNLATFAYVIQLCSVYFFAYLLKTGSAWHQDFSAVYFALHLDYFATFIAEALRQVEFILPFLTGLTLYLEGFGWLLLFVPFYQRWTRIIAIGLFVAMHLGFALTLKLGLFPFIGIVGWLPLLPTAFWDRLQRLVSEGEYPLTRHIEGAKTWILRWFPPRKIYFGKRKNFVERVVILTSLFLALSWNAMTINVWTPPGVIQSAAQVFRLDQQWNMFAPFPTREDGWFVMPAELKNGTKFDLYTGNSSVDWSKPDDISTRYPNQRWRKYMRNIWLAKYQDHRLYYGRYLCRKWNERHRGGEQLKSFKIYFMLENTTQYNPTPKPEKRHLWTHHCFDESTNG